MSLRESLPRHEVPRRSLVAGLIGITALSACGTALSSCGTGANGSLSGARSSSQPPDFTEAVDRLEHRYSAQVGVFALDTGTGRTLEHHADQRFMTCSAFKGIEAAAVLRRSQDDPGLLNRSVVVHADPGPIVEDSPFTGKLLGQAVDYASLCRAAVQFSDNIAANLLYDLLGGPAALTAFVRSLGDDVTRMDRREEEANVGKPDDLLDTTTPRAIATTYQQLVLGTVLAEGQRQQLADWLLGATTGNQCVRAGLPSDWKVADKTGTGPRAQGDRNDVAIAWPAGGRSPLVIAVLTRTPPPAEQKDQLLADVARAAAATLAL